MILLKINAEDCVNKLEMLGIKMAKLKVDTYKGVHVGFLGDKRTTRKKLKAVPATTTYLEDQTPQLPVPVDTPAIQKKNRHNLSVKEIVKILSLGTPTIPPRPFMRDFARDKHKMLLKLLNDNVQLKKEVASTKKGKRILHITAKIDGEFIGATAAEIMKKWITNDQFYAGRVPNAASTVERKGFNNPYMEDGDLVKYIKYRVVQRPMRRQ